MLPSKTDTLDEDTSNFEQIGKQGQGKNFKKSTVALSGDRGVI